MSEKKIIVQMTSASEKQLKTKYNLKHQQLREKELMKMSLYLKQRDQLGRFKCSVCVGDSLAQPNSLPTTQD